jgi:hypothetical protein
MAVHSSGPLSSVAMSLQCMASTMDENNNPRSADLGVFVMMAVVPIVVYVMAVLVLSWVRRGFH